MTTLPFDDLMSIEREKALALQEKAKKNVIMKI